MGFLFEPSYVRGWTITREQQQIILAHCRKHGIWLMADDVYERLIYDQPAGQIACAPSFLDIADADERVVSTNSFSKSWLMTGWRLGWMQVPTSLMADLGKLIEYNTSCAPVFVQRAGKVVRIDDPVAVLRALHRRDHVPPEEFRSVLLRPFAPVAPLAGDLAVAEAAANGKGFGGKGRDWHPDLVMPSVARLLLGKEQKDLVESSVAMKRSYGQGRQE